MGGDDQVFGRAPLVWRSTLRGVVVLGDDVRLLEGMAAAVWLALDDGPLTVPGVVEELDSWSLDVSVDEVASTLGILATAGLLVS